MCGLILAGSATGRDLSRHNAGNQPGDFVDNQPERTAPVLPLRDVVVFPQMAIPLFVGREKSIKALTAAMQDDRSEEHTSELQSLMRRAYAVFCLKKKILQNKM